jgi:hypothetical protein
LAAVIVTVAIVAVAGPAVALERPENPAADRSPATPATSVPPASGEPSSSSCVEVYSRTTLANRELAFDGTITAVDGDEISFDVNRWYTADEGDSATLNGASTLGAVTSAGDPLNLDVGSRLLVAGDDGFAWSCGFTQPYHGVVAACWAAVFHES